MQFSPDSQTVATASANNAVPPQLGLALWPGKWEGCHDTWLRWCNATGQVLPTGDAQAAQERQRAERERQRGSRLAALRRDRGIDPQDCQDLSD